MILYYFAIAQNTEVKNLTEVYMLVMYVQIFYHFSIYWSDTSLSKWRERSRSLVECLTRDRRAAGSSLTGVTALCHGP